MRKQRFQSYLDDLAAKGLDRDKPGVRSLSPGTLSSVIAEA